MGYIRHKIFGQQIRLTSGILTDCTRQQDPTTRTLRITIPRRRLHIFSVNENGEQ